MALDELAKYGMLQMDDDDIEQTLTRQSIGVLGVPTDAAPMLRPLSFWYDGESTLYFVYVLGGDSRKAVLSDRASVARFLIYDIETTFNWRSVLLTGTISPVPEDEREAIEQQIDIAWRPNVFERAAESTATGLYAFHIEERAGIEQLELPAELRDESSMSSP